jgi:hypothetical protein
MDPTLGFFLICVLFGAYLGSGIDTYQHRNDDEMNAS